MFSIISRFFKKNYINIEEDKQITNENNNKLICFHCKKEIPNNIYYFCFNCNCIYHLKCKKNLLKKCIKYKSLNCTYKICTKCKAIGSIFEKKIELNKNTSHSYKN